MKSYITDFIKAAINDVEVSEEILVDFVDPLITDEIGSIPEQRADFIKPLLEVTGFGHVARIMADVVDADVEAFSKLVGIDIDSLESIEEKRAEWELTDFSPEFEELLDELNDASDKEIDAHITTTEVKEPEYKF